MKRAHERLESDALPRMRGKQRFDDKSIAHAVRVELENLVTVDANLETFDDRARVLALVGPPGCGKTTTLVKLACATAGLRAWRATDYDRYAARGCRGTATTYAAILGAGFDAVETTRGLEQALEANREKGLILIDTQGYAANEMGEAAEPAHFLSDENRIEVHLAAAASMRSADLEPHDPTGTRYSLRPKLIFTRIR